MAGTKSNLLLQLLYTVFSHIHRFLKFYHTKKSPADLASVAVVLLKIHKCLHLSVRKQSTFRANAPGLGRLTF